MKSEPLDRYKKLQKWVLNSYRHHAIFLFGHGDGEIKFNVANLKNPQKGQAAFAVKYYPEKKVLVAWDMVRRREHSGTQNFALNKNWDDINPNVNTIYAAYCTYKGSDGSFYWDKVVVVGELSFCSFFENPEMWLALNEEDSSYPRKLSSSKDGYILSDRERKRYSVSQLERDSRFRHAVLETFQYQCAVCRINIKEVLQAAHLHNYEVSNTDLSADNPSHGICLCANHHLMYDRGLIDLDVQNNIMHILDNSLRNIEWYS